MLILTRRVGETLMIGDEVTVTVLGVFISQLSLRKSTTHCDRSRGSQKGPAYELRESQPTGFYLAW